MPNPTKSPGPAGTPGPPELAEFSGVHQDADGLWHATHTSGEKVSGESWAQLELMATAVRIAKSWGPTSGSGWSV